MSPASLTNAVVGARLFGAVAITALLIAIDVLWAQPQFGAPFGFIVLLAAVALSSAYGGTAAGLASLAITAVVAPLTLETPSTFDIVRPDDVMRYAQFLAVGIGLVWLIAKLRASRSRAETRASELRQSLARAEAAERSLRESERRFATMAETVPDILFISAANGACEYANRRWTEYSGKRVDEIAGFRWIDSIHRDDLEAAKDARQRAQATLSMCEARERIRGADGVWRWFMVRAVPVLDADGNIERWFGCATDIDAIETTRAQLRASEERLTLALDAAELGTFDLDLRTSALTFSARAKEIYGFAPDAGVTLERVLACTHPDDLPLAWDAQHATRDSDDPERRRVDIRILPADGSPERSISVRFRTAFGEVDGEHKALRSGGTVQDVTAAQRHRLELERSEERFRLAGEAVAGLIYDVDLAAGRAHPSQGFRAITGHDIDEVPQTVEWWRSRVHPEDLRRLANVEKLAIQSRAPRREVEYRIRHRDGRWIHLIDRSLITYEGGRAVRMVGCALDVTGLRTAEARLLEADARKDRFIAVLAHELRNPLAPISNGLDLMRLAAGDAAVVERARKVMERQLPLITRLIDDLSDVSRIDSDKLRVQRRRVPIAGVLQAAVESVQPLVERMRHRLELQMPEPDLMVDVDPSRIEQVVSNLLTNAAKYTPQGGHIALTAKRANDGIRDELCIGIRDNGIGIAPSELASVFDMYRQIDSESRDSQGGLGIGLALARALVQLHGGTIVAASDGAGKGAEFTVRLPLRAPSVTPPEQVLEIVRSSSVTDH